MRDIDEFRLWTQFLRPGANLRLTGISGRGVIGYVEFSDWLSETELHACRRGIYVRVLHSGAVMGGFARRLRQLRELQSARVFTAIESGGWMAKSMLIPS